MRSGQGVWHGRGDEGEEVRECGTGEGQGEKDGRCGERGEREEEWWGGRGGAKVWLWGSKGQGVWRGEVRSLCRTFGW